MRRFSTKNYFFFFFFFPILTNQTVFLYCILTCFVSSDQVFQLSSEQQSSNIPLGSISLPCAKGKKKLMKIPHVLSEVAANSFTLLGSACNACLLKKSLVFQNWQSRLCCISQCWSGTTIVSPAIGLFSLGKQF